VDALSVGGGGRGRHDRRRGRYTNLVCVLRRFSRVVGREQRGAPTIGLNRMIPFAGDIVDRLRIGDVGKARRDMVVELGNSGGGGTAGPVQCQWPRAAVSDQSMQISCRCPRFCSP
jgi:hypothetical protein